MGTAPGDGILLKHALDMAASWHRNQRRKYPGLDIPYVTHLAGVVALLARHGFDEEVQAAGALHDALEDAGKKSEEIAALFGDRVAELVRATTEDDKSRSWEERKAASLGKFTRGSWEAQAIALADATDNLRSILVCRNVLGEDPWPALKRGKAQQLQRWEDVWKAVRRKRHPLAREYRRALDLVREA